MKFITSILLLFIAFSASAQSKSNDEQLMEYFQSQRYNDALDYLKKSYPEPVSDIRILSRLGYVAQLANKLPDAEGYYQRAFDLDTTNLTALFNMGGINLKRGNLAKAGTYYKIIAQKDTNNFFVYKQLGGISERKNDTVAAVKYYERANQLNPNDVDVASTLSDYYVSFKNFDKAYSILKKASENDPNDVTILLSTQKLVYSQKKWKETIDVCYKLISLEAGSGLIYEHMGVAYYNLANYACGAESLALIKSDEQSEYSYYYAAICYKKLGDKKTAIDFFNRAIAAGLSTNIPNYYGEIGGIEEDRGKFKKAVQAYQKSLQFQESATVYYLLASLYDGKLKDKGNAVKYYKKYLAAKPSGKDQNTYLAFAKSRIEQLKN